MRFNKSKSDGDFESDRFFSGNENRLHLFVFETRRNSSKNGFIGFDYFYLITIIFGTVLASTVNGSNAVTCRTQDVNGFVQCCFNPYLST